MQQTSQFQTLTLRRLGKEIQCLFDCRPKIKVDRFQLHPTGFDFREVKNIVDDVEQGFTGSLHGLGVVALLRRHVCFEQKSVHSHDAVHGGTNFMAHDGKKGRLGLCGGLSFGQCTVEVAILLLKFLGIGVNARLRPFPFKELSELAPGRDESLQ